MSLRSGNSRHVGRLFLSADGNTYHIRFFSHRLSNVVVKLGAKNISFDTVGFFIPSFFFPIIVYHFSRFPTLTERTYKFSLRSHFMVERSFLLHFNYILLFIPFSSPYLLIYVPYINPPFPSVSCHPLLFLFLSFQSPVDFCRRLYQGHPIYSLTNSLSPLLSLAYYIISCTLVC